MCVGGLIVQDHRLAWYPARRESACMVHTDALPVTENACPLTNLSSKYPDVAHAQLAKWHPFAAFADPL